jgi:hypothetical protein
VDLLSVVFGDEQVDEILRATAGLAVVPGVGGELLCQLLCRWNDGHHHRVEPGELEVARR